MNPTHTERGDIHPQLKEGPNSRFYYDLELFTWIELESAI